MYNFLLMPIMINTCQSQPLKFHQWQNRLLLVIAEDSSNINFQKQINHLHSYKEDLAERKLLIYKVFPNQHSKGLENENLESSSDLYKKYNSKAVPFKVLLVGLDAGVKLKQTEIITIKELKGIIDAMPMRMEELRKRKNE